MRFESDFIIWYLVNNFILDVDYLNMLVYIILLFGGGFIDVELNFIYDFKFV